MSKELPACVCTAHPKGEDKRKYMVVAECAPEFVVFCCKRCTEITHTAVVQVRTLGDTKARAQWMAKQERQRMDPSLLRMLHARKRGGVVVKEKENA